MFPPKYEHKILSSKTLDGLSEKMSRVACIRREEIEQLVEEGYDCIADYPGNYFKPVGVLSFVNGEYVQIMQRTKP